jgi:nucleotide-binding universal stress UspA family protein
MKDILVGIDGSPASRHALDRALRLGQVTGRTVRVVHAWAPPAPRTAALGAGYLHDPFEERECAHAAALSLLDTEVGQALARLATDAPVTVRAEDVEGGVGPALVKAAATSTLVLLGTRGRGRVGNLLGSSIPYVLHHATCPVMVVPTYEPHEPTYRRVVVGVDGSEWSRSALLWAYELARVEKRPLTVLHAVAREDSPIQVAERTFWRTEVLSMLPIEPEVEVEVTLLPGHPEAVLRGELGPDDLLVVGSRGSSGIAGVLLGSVSAACVSHPHVPVLVVRAYEEGLAHLFAAAAPAAEEE